MRIIKNLAGILIALIAFLLFIGIANAANVIGNGETGLFNVELRSTSNTVETMQLSLDLPPKVKGSISDKVVTLYPGDKKSIEVELTPAIDIQSGDYTAYLVGTLAGKPPVREKETPKQEVELVSSQELIIDIDELQEQIDYDTIRLKVANDVYSLNEPQLEIEPRGLGGRLHFYVPAEFKFKRTAVDLYFEDVLGNGYRLDFRVNTENTVQQAAEEPPEFRDVFGDVEEQLTVVLGAFEKQIDEDSIRVIIKSPDLGEERYDSDSREVKQIFRRNDIIFVVERELKDQDELDVSVFFNDDKHNKFRVNYDIKLGDNQIRNIEIITEIDEDELDNALKQGSVMVVFEDRQYFENQNNEVQVNHSNRIVTFRPERTYSNGHNFEYVLQAKDETNDTFKTSGQFNLTIAQFEEVSDDVLKDIFSRKDKRFGEVYIAFDEFDNRFIDDSVKLTVDSQDFDERDEEITTRFLDDDDIFFVILRDNMFDISEKIDVKLQFEDQKSNEYELSYTFFTDGENAEDIELRIFIDELGDIEQDSIRFIVENKRALIVEDQELEFNHRNNEVTWEPKEPIRLGERTRFRLEAKDKNRNSVAIDGVLVIDFDRLSQEFGRSGDDISRAVDAFYARASQRPIDYDTREQLEEIKFYVLPYALDNDIDDDFTEVILNGKVYDDSSDELIVTDREGVRLKIREDRRFEERLGFEVKARDRSSHKFEGRATYRINVLKGPEVEVAASPEEIASQNAEVLRQELKFRVERTNLLSGGLEITGLPKSLELAPGQEQLLAISINNPTNEIMENVEIRMRGLSKDTVFEPIKVGTLQARSSRTVTGAFKVLEGAGFKNYPLTLEVVSDKYTAAEDIYFKTESKEINGESLAAAFATFFSPEGLSASTGLIVLLLVLGTVIFLFFKNKPHTVSKESALS